MSVLIALRMRGVRDRRSRDRLADVRSRRYPIDDEGFRGSEGTGRCRGGELFLVMCIGVSRVLSSSAPRRAASRRVTDPGPRGSAVNPNWERMGSTLRGIAAASTSRRCCARLMAG